MVGASYGTFNLSHFERFLAIRISEAHIHNMEVLSWFWEGGTGFIRVANVMIAGAKLGPSEIHMSYWKPCYWHLLHGETEWTRTSDVKRMHRISLLEITDRTCVIVGSSDLADGWIGIRCIAIINSILPCVYS